MYGNEKINQEILVCLSCTRIGTVASEIKR